MSKQVSESEVMSSKFKTEFVVDESRIEEHKTAKKSESTIKKRESTTPKVHSQTKQAAAKLRAAARDNAVQNSQNTSQSTSQNTSQSASRSQQVPKTVITTILQHSSGPNPRKENGGKGKITVHNNQVLIDRKLSNESRASTSSSNGANNSYRNAKKSESSGTTALADEQVQQGENVALPPPSAQPESSPPSFENKPQQPSERPKKAATSNAKFVPTNLNMKKTVKKSTTLRSNVDRAKSTKVSTTGKASVTSKPTNIAQSPGGKVRGLSSKPNVAKSTPMSADMSALGTRSKRTKVGEAQNTAAKRSKDDRDNTQLSQPSAQPSQSCGNSLSSAQGKDSASLATSATDSNHHQSEPAPSLPSENSTGQDKIQNTVLEHNDPGLMLPSNAKFDDKNTQEKTILPNNRPQGNSSARSIITNGATEPDAVYPSERGDAAITATKYLTEPEGAMHNESGTDARNQTVHRMPSNQRWTPNKEAILSQSSYRKPSTIAYQPLHLLLTSASAHNHSQAHSTPDATVPPIPGSESKLSSTPVQVDYSNPAP